MIKSLNNCILCDSQNIEISKSFDRANLINLWKQIFQIDVSKDLPNDDLIHLIRCHCCDLQFFSSVRSGGASFYEQLQKFDWYYLLDKWEYRIASQDINNAIAILEVGSGPGFFATHLLPNQHRKLYALETNSKAAKLAVTKGYQILSLTDENVVSNYQSSFDLIVLFQVLEHLDNPLEFLNQLKPLLKPQGRVIVTVPNARGYLRFTDTLLNMPPHHLTRWSAKTLLTLADRLGLDVTKIQCEPLAKYHISGYVEAYASLLRRPRIGRLLYRNILSRSLISFLYRTGLYRLCKGEGIYVCFQNTQSKEKTESEPFAR